MINNLPYLYCVVPVCVGGVVVLCGMYFGELMSRGEVKFMTACTYARARG